MAKPSERSGSAIEKLLEERGQYEQWLARLSESDASEQVRSRVRADYEMRLSGVIEQLRAHETTIGAELARYEAEQAQLDEREADVLETLSEAQVRHAVGEYDDSQWATISGAKDKALVEVRSSLDRVRGEIARLSEVQRLILAKPAASAPGAAPVAPPPAPPPATETSTPRFVPKPPLPQSPPPKPHGDELDFLKSVAVEQSASLGQRNSGAQPVVTTAADPASPGGGGQRTNTATGAKTLKCGECGTLNRPTEWYCERCGAELAAL